MATYRVTLDEEGELVVYERTRRYTRGQIDRRGQGPGCYRSTVRKANGGHARNRA